MSVLQNTLLPAPIIAIFLDMGRLPFWLSNRRGRDGEV